ncbi:MAG: selenide, water dikinase SelD [Ferruginibacter sp.]
MEKLTQYSRAAGCGCKIAPAQLQEILSSNTEIPFFENLITGNAGNEDAAVYDLGNGESIISTTDFFMPVVDDAFDFGSIASANAISDVYAMGGIPLMAIAILGWPIEKLPATLAQQVLEGARDVCAKAGIPLAGGHSVDSAEPLFGLAVTGRIATSNIKKNNTAQAGDAIFITKPIGTGILSTAQKRGLISDEHAASMVIQMKTLNNIGSFLGSLNEVTAMTDITGFGLMGHLIEMAEGANLSATINYASIPFTEGVKDYLNQKAVPDATYRNWNAYSKKVKFEKGVNVMEAFTLLPDPQTNGGLMFTVSVQDEETLLQKIKAENPSQQTWKIGQFILQNEKIVIVEL